jgi:uncharacterized protein (TIGR02246 family)
LGLLNSLRMKRICVVFWLCLIAVSSSAQEVSNSDAHHEIRNLIADYTRARTAKDTMLLKQIVMPDIDQLVSSGTWRRGREAALAGMMQSSEANPGSRTITVDNIRFLDPACAIADARYEIKNPDGSVRKMWSTFIVVQASGRWKIAAIRNMLPTAYNN